MYTERCNSTFGRKLLFYNIPLIWNRWCNFILNVSSRSHFKKQVNHFILSSYSDSVNCSNKRCRDCFRNLIAFHKYIIDLYKNWSIWLNSVLYCFVSLQHYLTLSNNKMLLSHHPVIHPSVCPALFHSASFTVPFYVNIKPCRYDMLGSASVTLALQSQLTILYCIIALYLLYSCTRKWKINFSLVLDDKICTV